MQGRAAYAWILTPSLLSAETPFVRSLVDLPTALCLFGHVITLPEARAARGSMRRLGKATDPLAVGGPGAQDKGADLAARACVPLRMHKGHEGSDKWRMYGPWL